MKADPYIVRFTIGKTYRLHTTKDMPALYNGTIQVKAELSHRDRLGNRVLMVDAHLTPNEADGKPIHLLGARCFVEEGCAREETPFGSKTTPVEIASIIGLYPRYAKAYANAEVSVNSNLNRSVA